MTTATKLRLGFGALIILFALSSVMTIVRFQSLQRGATEEVGLARDRRNEAVLLVLYVEGYDLAVRTYTQTGDRKYLELAGQRAGDLEQHFATYEKMALTEVHREFVARFKTLWPPVKERGQRMLDATTPPDQEDSVRLAEDRTTLENFLVNEMVSEAINSYEARRGLFYQDFRYVGGSALVLLLIGIGVAVLTSWVVGRGIVNSERDTRAEQQKLRITLSSIGDAVITTDTEGRVVFLNPVAETLTGWTQQDAEGRPLEEVFRVINEDTRAPVDNPAVRAARDGVVVGLANHTLLVSRDGTERPIDDSAAPIYDEGGRLVGVVLVFRDITARKRAEATEAHLAAIVMSSHDAIVSKDLNGVIKTWNEGARRLFGYTADEIIGKPVTVLIPPDHLDEEPRILDRVVKGESIEFYETVRKRKDGSLVDVALRVSPVRNAAGEIIGASKNARDITESKQAARELRESHARFEALFQSSSMGVYLLDDELRIRQISPKARPTFIEVPDLIGSDFRDVARMMTHPAAADEISRYFQHVLDTGEPLSAPEFFVDRIDRGTKDYYDWRIERIALPNDQYGLVCSFYDVTGLVLAREEAHSAALRFQRLFESAHDGILIVDADTSEIVDANAHISAVVGIEQESLIGKKFIDLHVGSGARDTEAILRQVQHAQYIREETTLRNVRGEQIDVEIVANVYHEGDRLLAQFNVRDIRERLLLEGKIRQQAEILAGESKRKDEFLAMLSHELRNPLAPIRSAVYLLKMHEQGPEHAMRRQAFEIIERQVANLTKLVSDLLEMSRVVSGRIRLNVQTLNLNQIIAHAAQTAAPLMAQRRHELIVHRSDDSAWINGDATRIEEVLINLLSNAAKYTDEGGRIEVYCERPEGGDYAEVRVRDNGIGIDPALLPSIFDLFTQSERSLARSEGGLGIGLNLVHRLVELHGGGIEAHSPPPGQPRGSEFVVRFPAVPAPDGPELSEPIDDTVPAISGRRVLVVDDNVDQVTMLVSSLRHRGYAVQSAHTGPDGLKAALQWHPDILLMDIGLPGLSGYDVARQVRSMPAGDKMKLIALTGYGREADIALAREAGFDIHLTKPCDFDELARLLTE